MYPQETTFCLGAFRLHLLEATSILTLPVLKGEQRMFKKLGGLLLAAAVVLGGGISANAAEGGSIQVSLDAGELPVTNGAITLYQVGIPMTGGYRITEVFGGGIVKKEDAQSEHLALWLAESAGGTGRTLGMDVEGDVTFSNLQDGLYLVVQTERMDGFYPVNPFLVELSEDSGREVHAFPKTEPIMIDNPQTGDPFTPLLGAMGLVASGIGLYLCVDNRRKK